MADDATYTTVLLTNTSLKGTITKPLVLKTIHNGFTYQQLIQHRACFQGTDNLSFPNNHELQSTNPLACPGNQTEQVSVLMTLCLIRL